MLIGVPLLVMVTVGPGQSNQTQDGGEADRADDCRAGGDPGQPGQVAGGDRDLGGPRPHHSVDLNGVAAQPNRTRLERELSDRRADFHDAPPLLCSHARIASEPARKRSSGPAGRTGWWKTTLSSPSVSAPVTLRLGRGSPDSTRASQSTVMSPV